MAFGEGSFGGDLSYSSPQSGGGSNPFDNELLRRAYFLQNPRASYGAFLTEEGATSTGFGRYLQTQEPRLQSQYQAALADNPYMSYLDYLREQRNRIFSAFNNLSPYQRGEDPSRVAGRVRYVGF